MVFSVGRFSFVVLMPYLLVKLDLFKFTSSRQIAENMQCITTASNKKHILFGLYYGVPYRVVPKYRECHDLDIQLHVSLHAGATCGYVTQ